MVLTPLRYALPGFLVVATPWAGVLLGRRVCLVAQRVPALVWLVRAVYRWKDARAVAGEGSARREPPTSAAAG